ncbi:MAG: divalent-cation tolerance protein CutA [Magnetospirillum sp.]|nr:divalent-cation tolerance protein CutA [Magnetospirillum sp.]
MSDYVFVYITVASPEQAVEIGRALVEARLAACANVLPGATAVYWWEGAVRQDSEAVLVAKTRAGLARAVVDKVREIHTYACPCVVCLPIVAGNPAFLDWIGAETRPGGGEAAD